MSRNHQHVPCRKFAETPPTVSRRTLMSLAAQAGSFSMVGAGLDKLAVSSLTAAEQGVTGHFPASANSVILLFMSGGPSQVDTFDPKPALKKFAGQDVPASIAARVPQIPRSGLKNLLPSPWRFARHGSSGLQVSELFPHVARHADDLCLIRSVHHRNPVHGPGECVALTGTATGDRPALGAWSIYGLGSANQNLPSYVAMNLHTDGMQYPQAAGWGPGFLPSRFQGTVVDPARGIRNLRTPSKTSQSTRIKQLELLDWWNGRHLEAAGVHSELDARRRSYSMAFRMQAAAPELFDLASETAGTRQLYGLDAGAKSKETTSTARGCLLARRLVERGVRFVQVRIGGWDAHGNIRGNHQKMARRTDQPVAALLTDLKRRGLLDTTLVVWCGEFGRTPTMEGRGLGRDHSPGGYSIWLAGGGVRPGLTYGRTDEFGYVAVENQVTPHDVHATILACLGLDAARLTYRHHGRDEVPTVFGGRIVKQVLQQPELFS